MASKDSSLLERSMVSMTAPMRSMRLSRSADSCVSEPMVWCESAERRSVLASVFSCAACRDCSIVVRIALSSSITVRERLSISVNTSSRASWLSAVYCRSATVRPSARSSWPPSRGPGASSGSGAVEDSCTVLEREKKGMCTANGR